MKQLLYIGRPNLGENLFATPCLELLSKDYEITFLTPIHTLPVFKKYPFLKRVLPGCNHGSTSGNLPLITKNELNNILRYGDWQYAYHHDDDVLFLQNHPEILQIKKYPVLHDREIDIHSNTHNSDRFLSRTKKYMLKLQIMTLEETTAYDCTVRRPLGTTCSEIKNNNTIIIYQGSKECLRKLPTETIEKFVKFLPTATFFVTLETATELQFDKNNIKYILTSPYSESGLKSIIELFETSPKVMIGPDSGLTQLASGYKIPLIWLQSRIVLENVIDSSYKKYCKVYFKSNLTCKQDCLGCVATKSLIMSPVNNGLFEVKEMRTPHKELECFINKDPICLRYSDAEVREIVQMID